jgi:uncharacterized ubiquitin-like protein YukD
MDKISIIIRVMPNGDELDVELPVLSTGKEIVEELLNANFAPRNDRLEEPFTYKICSKYRGIIIDENKTLYDIGIQDGDTIFLVPKIIAG